MKRIALVVLMVLAVTVVPAAAGISVEKIEKSDGKFVIDSPTTPEAVTVSDITLFFSGFTSGFFAHEYGHIATSDLHNIKIRWAVKSNIFGTTGYFQSQSSDRRKSRDIALAGFEAQILTTEILLNSPAKRNAFTFGWLWFNIMNSIVYVINDQTGRGGDINVYREAGGNDKALKAILISHAALSAYRLLSDAEPWFDVGVDPEKQGIMVTKTILRW